MISLQAATLAMVTACAATLILTPVARLLAPRLRMVAQPRADRWAGKATPKLGGAAIFLAVNAALLVAGLARQAWVVAVASAIMFLVGLVDDLVTLSPQHKLVLQLVPALMVVNYGLLLPWTSSQLLNGTFTVLWLVGITNAINLLDNMDGLATGIAAIGSLSLAVTFIRNGQLAEAVLIGTLFCALIGFLVYNFYPASIFMGDCGSLFIGFFLASAALLAATGGGRSRALLPVLIVPVLTLLIPIFDTTFVAFVRKLAGRSSLAGGRDHTSHRLVALGLHERTAVLLLYALTLLTGGIAIAARDLPYDLSIALTGAVTLLIAIFGFYLAGVKVYAADDSKAAAKPLTTFLIDVSYRRPVFQILLDLALITYAYYLAYRLHFGPPDRGLDWQRFATTLPIIVAVKIAVFLVTGLYSRMWRYLSFEDAMVFARAIGVSSAASVLVLLGISRFSGLSRVVFVLDGLILFVLIAATRSSFRLIERITRRSRSREGGGKRTLIYGAGDAGAMLLRELRDNPSYACEPVAFFDDDSKKSGKALHGVTICGGQLNDVLVTERIAEVIISTAKLAPERLYAAGRICRELGIPLTQMKITIVAVLPIPVPALDVTEDETPTERRYAATGEI